MCSSASRVSEPPFSRGQPCGCVQLCRSFTSVPGSLSVCHWVRPEGHPNLRLCVFGWQVCITVCVGCLMLSCATVVCPCTTHYILWVSDREGKGCIHVFYHACRPVCVDLRGIRFNVYAYEYCPCGTMHPGLCPCDHRCVSYHMSSSPWPLLASRHSVKYPLWQPGQWLGVYWPFHGFP